MTSCAVPAEYLDKKASLCRHVQYDGHLLTWDETKLLCFFSQEQREDAHGNHSQTQGRPTRVPVSPQVNEGRDERESGDHRQDHNQKASGTTVQVME